jgi:hypothetical protein
MLSKGLIAFFSGLNKLVTEANLLLFVASLKLSSEFIEITISELFGTNCSIECSV